MAQASKAADQVGKGAEDSAKKSGSAFSRLAKTAQENEKAWTTSGAVLTGFGAATVGALGLATKAAMDWESAWAGVQKTVDGTAPQMEALEAGLRGMARELPASHAEIAAVAEAAGQLGIATPNVLGFTRTMIDMGEASNLSAEEAATSLARFMNVMGTSQNEVGRLGAAIVGLGNNFATTESEIVAMAQRLSGAGAQAKLTEGDVLGIATAMSSVGIEAEAGGSAMSLTMKRIGKEVDNGGNKLELFAQVAGMSAEQFATAWKSDPAMALDAFITGLSHVESQGMTTNGVLAELGITGIRESDALLRLSAAAGEGADGLSLLAGAIQMGNEEFGKGTALIEEAAKRYETAESRIAMARNALVDLGISVGGVVLPAMAGLADSVGGVAGWFADLPAPVHQAATGLAAVVGSASLAAGTFLMLAPRVADTWDAFKKLNTSTNGVAGKVGKIGLAVGVAAAAMPLLVTGANAARDALLDIDRVSLTAGMEEMASRTMQAADATSAYDSLLGDLADSGALNTRQFDDLGTAISKVANMDALGKFGVSAGFAAGGMDLLVDRLTSTGDALALLYQTDLPRAQDSFNAIWAEAEAGGATFDELLSVMPAFKGELQSMANMLGEDATDSAVLFRIATGDLVPVVDEATGAVVGFADGVDDAGQSAADAADATEEYYKALRDLANEFITAERAALDYAESMEETAKAAKENGKHWEDGTEAADENKRALLDLAEQALATADSLAPKGESGTFLKEAREDLIDVATEMTGSRELAEEYVDQLLGTPDEIETIVKLETEQAKADWAALWDEIGYHPPEVPVGADTDPAKESVTEFEGTVMNGTPPEVPVGADTSAAEDEVHVFGSQVGDVPTTPVVVDADTEAGQATLRAFQREVNDAGGTVEINGETMHADAAFDTLIEEINAGDGTVTINGFPFPAEQALGALTESINMSDGTVTIEGNNKPAMSATDSAKRHADGTRATIDVDANTWGANSAINAAARTRTAYINVVATGATNVLRSAMSGVRRAAGGPVFGPGSGTSDSIPALLSNGEHVITAREVAMAGGQDAIYRMREAIRSGLKFANGGAVERGGRAPITHMAPVQRPSPASAPVDSGAIAAAVSSAMSSWQPMVQIGDQTVRGSMERAYAQSRERIVTTRRGV